MPSLLPPVFHPLLVHAPLVLLPLAALAALLRSRFAGASTATRWLLTFAAITSILAAASGFMEKDAAEEEWEGTPKEGWITTHTVLGFITAGAAVLLAIGAWVARSHFLDSVTWAWLTAILPVAMLVVATGWYGGAIVWDELPPVEFDSTGFGPATSTTETTPTEPTTAPATEPTSPGSPPSSPPSEPQPGTSPEPAPAPATSGCDDSAGGFTGEKTGETGASGLPIWELWVKTDAPLKYDPADIRVPKDCEIRLHYGNFDPNRKAHDLLIGEEGAIAKTPKLNAGGTYTLTFTVTDAMSIAFYCNVGNHRENGMEGTFTVA